MPNQANKCTHITMPVGVLRPDWLSNATYMGKSVVNGVAVYGYTKQDFIDYYADAETCAPVRWCLLFSEIYLCFSELIYGVDDIYHVITGGSTV